MGGNIDIMQPILTGLRQRLGDNLISVVLFGSRARGDEEPTSDWDLLIIARDLPKHFMERYWLIKEALPVEWRGLTSILARTPREFEATLPPLYLDIAIDGKILYDKNNYVQTRLSALRRLIKRKGLLREKQGRELIWKWKEFPGTEWSLYWDDAL
ncbi:MAG: nucleotidyltransferase domain-containing protein [Methanobacteriota archaeon]|nr:MAG: nucleotidyltransferase domain-containing protein [Euryarchaeota archaeon]